MKSAQTLVLDEARLAELRKGDPLDRTLADLLVEHDACELSSRLKTIEQEIWTLQPEGRNRRGAPLRWGENGSFLAYLSIESELRAARKKNPQATVSSVIDVKFKRLRGRPWRILTDTREGGHSHLEIAGAASARRRYYAGRKLVRENRSLARVASLILEPLR